MSLTYLLQMESPEGFVKFGRTKNPKSRIASLTTGSPWPIRLVALIGSDCEWELKQTFAANRVRGEWFAPTQELQDWLNAQFDAGKMVRQVSVDAAYINAVLKPRIREYLNGREPTNTPAGDLVIRILVDQLPTLTGREKDLISATKGHVTEAMCRGFGPTLDKPELILPADRRSTPEKAAA